MGDDLHRAEHRPPAVHPGRGPRVPLYLKALIALAVLLVGVAVLLPTITRPRETASRTSCRANMRQVGLAMLMYARENNGQFPDSLATLLRTQDITAYVFLCPSSNDSVATGTTVEELVENLAHPGTVSYIYIGAGLTTATADRNRIVMYEPSANHPGQGGNMLFADARVEFWPRERHSEWTEALEAAGQP